MSDRLARNSIDGGRVIYLVDTQKIVALKFPTFWFEATPQGKFMLSVAFGQAKYYTDNLRENILRGIRQKIRRGELSANTRSRQFNAKCFLLAWLARPASLCTSPVLSIFWLTPFTTDIFNIVARCMPDRISQWFQRNFLTKFRPHLFRMESPAKSEDQRIFSF